MPTIAADLRLTRSQAEDFLYRQAEYIDTRDFAAWIELFTPDACYWIPARPGDTDPRTQLSFMYDDVPGMAARCERLLDAGTGGQQPGTRCNHVVSNVRVLEGDAGDEFIVKSRFHVTQFRRDAMKTYAGAYTHRIVLTGQGPRIRSQRVDLVDCDGIHDAILQVYL